MGAWKRAGRSLRAIARRLGRDVSTVSREVGRNGGRERYLASLAEEGVQRAGLRPKPCLLARRRRSCEVVVRKLEQKWSPQQIAGWLKREYGSDEAMQVSHKTIYESLFIQARAGF